MTKKKAATKDNTMKALVEALYKQKLLFYLIASLSSDENLYDEEAKISTIRHYEEMKNTLKNVDIIPDDEKVRISNIIEKNIEICRNKVFSEKIDDK